MLCAPQIADAGGEFFVAQKGERKGRPHAGAPLRRWAREIVNGEAFPAEIFAELAREGGLAGAGQPVDGDDRVRGDARAQVRLQRGEIRKAQRAHSSSIRRPRPVFTAPLPNLARALATALSAAASFGVRASMRSPLSAAAASEKSARPTPIRR